MTRTCTACGIENPPSGFSPDKRAKDGLQPRCRECGNLARQAKYHADPEAARRRQRDYYQANPEKMSAINAKSRAKNPERVKAAKRAWYEGIREDPEWQGREKARRDAQKDQKRGYDREYRTLNAEKLSEQRARWAQENRDRQAIIKRAYKARRRAWTSEGDTTAALQAWELNAPKVCYWCGHTCKDRYHVDHYEPLARGGRHEVSNLVIACPPCNQRKSARDPYEFAVQVGRLF